MRRYGVDFTGGGVAIVTGDAIAGDAGVIEVCRDKSGRSMANPAILVGRYVVGRFWCRKTGAVARGTVVDDTRVIEDGRPESSGLMAIYAIAVGWYVTAVFSLGGNAVVTGYAVVDDTLVVEKGLGEGGGYVTYGAILSDRDMRRINFGACPGSGNAVVTGGAVIDDSAVVEYRWRKAAPRRVTNIAILGCWYVGGNGVHLADCGYAIVTGVAANCENGRVTVVDECLGKIDRVMAQRAIGGS